MHRLMFGHSFAELVALIVLPGLALYFLNTKKACVRRNAEDGHTGAAGSITAPIKANAGGSSSSPIETDNVASSLSSTETNSDASSSLTASTGNCYEVFLSFRGLDTRKGFTDHLYHGLLDAGIYVFRDNDELCEGQDIGPVLMEAITNSKVLIPIFSESYGESSWCLDELVRIMEQRKNNDGQIVLPIFYHVKPSDVGHQRGSFGDLFHEREERLLKRPSFDPTILKKWKKALREVSKVKGYEADGCEADLVKSIVRKVLSELKKKLELDISENLVGIDHHVKEVMESMDNKSHSTLFVGIHGMGGIGKTTLAKAIYNKLSNQFEHRSFIADIRESWNHNGIRHLQNQLIYDILHKNGFCNENEGTKFISSKFKHKKVLVILDDVDDVDQVKRLAGNRDWFSSGSRIIITTRNERILNEFGVDHIYDHKEMDNDQALILFSKHAFREDFPPRDYKVLTHDAVSIIGGLPLALVVLGSLLGGQKPAFWRDKIKKLKKVPLTKVREKLMISYEALDYHQQQIFLDIACFFIGTDQRIASYMWDDCEFYPEEGIEVLRFRSLIKIGDDHVLRMHDQLRDLGRAIVREENQDQPENRSRLWDSEEVQKVLKLNKGTENIKAIYLSEDSSEGSVYTEEQFKNLTSLRFLHVEGAHLSGDFKDSVKELRWLRWPNCPANFEVNNFHAKNLVALELSESNINERWQGWSSFMMAEKLKFLNLSYCKSLEATDFLSAFKKLEVLILNYCERLQQIDSSIRDMKELRRLELGLCYGFTEKPVLHKILSALPDSIVSLQNLEILNISGSDIRELPNNIGRLRQLRELRASWCRKMEGEMPESIGSLENLEILEISGSGIRGLPNSIKRLRKLRVLEASYCKNLKGKMPESMCKLSSLQRFVVEGCDELQSLPDLPSSLTYLGVTCQSRILPSLSHLTRLKELSVTACKFLECIPEFPPTLLKNSECSQLTYVEESELPQSLNTPFKLEILYVGKCESIEILDLPQFERLKKLDVHDCENLVKLQGLDRLVFLEELSISKCASIERLFLPKSGSLKILEAKLCMNLAKIRGLDRSEFLERLSISHCASIERLDLPKSGSLKRLHVSNCEILVEIQSLDRLEFLEMLNICWCTSIERLNLPKSRRLKQLDVSVCNEIQGLNRLEFLETLNIRWCTSIERLNLRKSSSLKQLDVSGCKILVKIQGLDRLKFLEELSITDCDSIERLDLPKSGSLKRLHVSDCKLLLEIKGLDRQEFLEELSISQCASIEGLRILCFYFCFFVKFYVALTT